MSLGDFKDGLEIAALLVAVFVWPAVIVRLRREFPSKAAHNQLRDDVEAHIAEQEERHKDIEARLAQGEREFDKIMSEIRHLPTRADIDDLKGQLHAVDKGVVELHGSIKAVAARLGAVENPVRDIVRNALEDIR